MYPPSPQKIRVGIKVRVTLGDVTRPQISRSKLNKKLVSQQILNEISQKLHNRPCFSKSVEMSTRGPVL